jgi:hypothetical protein
MLVLFDQGTPVPLRQFLAGHTIRTAAEQRWTTLQNGQLLDTAEAAGFDLLLTTDQTFGTSRTSPAANSQLWSFGRHDGRSFGFTLHVSSQP